MYRRPQSAVAKLSKVDDILSQQDSTKQPVDSFETTQLQARRPFSGMSDQTRPKFVYDTETRPSKPQSQDLEQDLHQARYALKLNQIEDAIENYKTSLNRAVHLIPSYQFMELFGQVFKSLNSKALGYVKEGDIKSADKLIYTLLLWTQVQRGVHPPEFLTFIKCPVTYQVLVLNSYALQLVKQHKFDDSQQQLEQALAAISSSKIEDQVQPYIGLTYLNYSTSLLYQQQYQNGMEVAQTALTYLQQSLLQGQQQQIQSEVSEYVSEAYINVAIAKEKLKLYQEAHFNYYSALVNAKQSLPPQKQIEINNIYDKFLSRQASYLQMVGQNKKQPRYSAKPNKEPFIDLVKSLEESGRVTSSNMVKRQRLLLKQKREHVKREQRSLNKFRPYTELPIPPPGYTHPEPHKPRSTKLLKRKSENNLRTQEIRRTAEITPQPSKSFKIKRAPQLSSQKQQGPVRIQVQDQASPVIRSLEQIVQDQQLVEQHDVIQLEDFQEIRLPLSTSPTHQQSLMVGQLVIYLFRLKNILYMRYNAFEQSIVDQFQHQAKEYKQLVYGHSFNVSDIANEIYSERTEDTDRKYAQFLRGFILEICRYLQVNKARQSLSVSRSLNQVQKTDQRQISFFLGEIDDYVSVQVKNDYESLIFIQSQDQRDEG